MRSRSRSLLCVAAVILFVAACNEGGEGEVTTTQTPTPITTPTSEAAMTTGPDTTTTLPRGNPVPRGYLAMTSLGDRGGVMVYGGFSGPPPDGTELTDTWTYTATAGWTDMAPQGPGVGSIAIAHDSESDRVIMASFDGDLWAYDPSSNGWEMKVEGVSGGLVYDIESAATIAMEPSAITAYDFDTNTWTEMEPATGAMPPREWPAMAYDLSCDRVIVFGGYDPLLGDTWAYDFNTNTWTKLAPEVSPPARGYSAMAYDPASKRTILFGGIFVSETIDDTWAFDCAANTWTELATDVAPSPRGKHGMAFNAEDGTIVLFGGGPLVGKYPNWEGLADTWIFDPVAENWSPIS